MLQHILRPVRLALPALLIAAGLPAQAVRATVTDQGTGAPVAGALVRVEEETGALVRAGFSDARGTVRLPVLGGGRYVVSAERAGYTRARVTLLVQSSGEHARGRAHGRQPVFAGHRAGDGGGDGSGAGLADVRAAARHGEGRLPGLGVRGGAARLLARRPAAVRPGHRSADGARPVRRAPAHDADGRPLPERAGERAAVLRGLAPLGLAGTDAPARGRGGRGGVPRLRRGAARAAALRARQRRLWPDHLLDGGRLGSPAPAAPTAAADDVRQLRTSALPHIRTSALPHSRTPALPHSRTPALSHFRTFALSYFRTFALPLPARRLHPPSGPGPGDPSAWEERRWRSI